MEPALKDDAFLADVSAGRADMSDSFRLWWLGQSGFLLQHKGKHLLLDPYLSDSLTEKYAGTDKPHTRMTARVIDPARLDFIDAITASHHHTDHLDGPTLRALLQANPAVEFVVPRAHAALTAERATVSISRLKPVNAGDTVKVGPFMLMALPSAHDQLEQDANGCHKYLGFVVRFGGFAVYHSGDTRLYPGLAGRLTAEKLDVALLPINGYDPARRVAGNLSGTEAANLAREIAAKLVIPHHFDMFAFNTADPAAEFIPICGSVGQRFRVLRNGECFDSRAPVA